MNDHKDIHARVVKLLADGADKATHEGIAELRQALTDQLAEWHGRLASIAKTDNGMGPERRKVLETGTIDDALKLEMECQQLAVWIDRADVQRAALIKLDKAVFARESLAGLPKHYQRVYKVLADVVEANRELVAGWQEVTDLVSQAETMRKAAATVSDDVPIADDELRAVLELAWRGACPYPAPGAFDPLTRGNIAEMLGLTHAMQTVEGMPQDVVGIAA